MKASNHKASFILLSVILTLGFILAGCKKETPPPQELTAKEKEFLSAPDAVTCELEKTTIFHPQKVFGILAGFLLQNTTESSINLSSEHSCTAPRYTLTYI